MKYKHQDVITQWCKNNNITMGKYHVKCVQTFRVLYSWEIKNDDATVYMLIRIPDYAHKLSQGLY